MKDKHFQSNKSKIHRKEIMGDLIFSDEIPTKAKQNQEREGRIGGNWERLAQFNKNQKQANSRASNQRRTNPHKKSTSSRTRSHPSCQIWQLQLLTLLSFLKLHSMTKSLTSHREQTIRQTKFTHISTRYLHGYHQLLYSIAITSDGRLFSIPKRIHLYTPFNLNLKGGRGDFDYPIKNAVFLTPEVCFALFSRSGSLNFQLFEFNKNVTHPALSTVGQESIEGGYASGQIKSGEEVFNNIYVDKINYSEDQIIFVFNQRIDILRYSSKTKSIHLYKERVRNIGSFKEKWFKGVSLNFGDTFSLLVVKLDEKRERSVLQLLLINFHMTSEAGTEVDRYDFPYFARFSIDYESYDSVYVCASGLKHIERYQADFMFTSGPMIYMATLVQKRDPSLIQHQNVKFTHEISLVKGISPIPNTIFYLVLAQKGREYTGDGKWDQVYQKTLFLIFENIKSPHKKFEYIMNFAYSQEFQGNYPIGDSFVVTDDSNAIFVAEWNNFPNIIFTGQIFDLYCPDGTVRLEHSRSSNPKAVQCIDQDVTNLKYCDSIIDPWSMSCYKCLPDEDDIFYDSRVVSIPYYHQRRTCFQKGFKCLERGMLIGPDWKSCYDCSAIVSDCDECTEFSIGCNKCKDGNFLNLNTFLCDKCSRFSANCKNCFQQKKFPTDKFFGVSCKECLPG